MYYSRKVIPFIVLTVRYNKVYLKNKIKINKFTQLTCILFYSLSDIWVIYSRDKHKLKALQVGKNIQMKMQCNSSTLIIIFITCIKFMLQNPTRCWRLGVISYRLAFFPHKYASETWLIETKDENWLHSVIHSLNNALHCSGISHSDN